jgi:hypothetical protein
MLVLSTGHARVPGEQDACGSESCAENAGGTPPTGFPLQSPSCPISSVINDDVGLSVTLRVPTNAAGYAFDTKFYSFEYPQWVCDSFNDEFIALVSPAPQGSLQGDIAFDSRHNPISVNAGFFTECDPSTIGSFASQCAFGSNTCPVTPSPYCPEGTGPLAGSGFDVWGTTIGSTYGGATSWLQTQAPATPGSEVTIRFLIWDGGDQGFDSTVLLDHFHWITASTAPGVGTAPH